MNAVALFAAHLYGYSAGEIAIGIVVIAALVALVLIALNQFGIKVPEWVKQVGWVLIVALVIIISIRLVMSM